MAGWVDWWLLTCVDETVVSKGEEHDGVQSHHRMRERGGWRGAKSTMVTRLVPDLRTRSYERLVVVGGQSVECFQCVSGCCLNTIDLFQKLSQFLLLNRVSGSDWHVQTIPRQG